MKAIVLYNLALAHVRAGEVDAAVAMLNDVAKLKGVRVEKKANSLKARIKAAQEKNSVFKLKAGDSLDANKSATDIAKPAGEGAAPADAATLASEADYRRMLAAVEAKRGDACCYLIFTASEAEDTKLTALLSKHARFAPREAIAREESMGAERTTKSAS